MRHGSRISKIVVLLGVAWFAAASHGAVGDDRFIQVRDAWKAGDRSRLARLTETLGDHELRPWAEYWLLRQKLEQGDDSMASLFLEREKGSYLAEKLRGDWLRHLGRSRNWTVFEKEYSALMLPEQDVTCYALQQRLTRAEPTVRDAALLEARSIWFSANELAPSCQPVMDILVAEKRLDGDDVWERVRRMLEAKKLRDARAAARYLPNPQIPDAAVLDTIMAKPAVYLTKRGSKADATRLEREMVLFAAQRMARQDPLPTSTLWRGIEDKYSEAERGYVWGQLATQAAMRHQPEALAWYEQAGTTPLSEEQLAWKARAALRASDWLRVRRAIEKMPQTQAADPTWVYWLGRSLMVHGKRDDALALYRKIAGQPNFYSNLADEELGRMINVPTRAAVPTTEELTTAAARPGLRRALALMRVDMRLEGVREWVWTLRGLDDRQLLAAAEFARRSEVWDRAINTADRTVAQHDYSLRFVAPFRENVEPKARQLALDNGWVYGLMRQESRFVIKAKSSVGAQGLMQLMPTTAKWVAHKIGLSDYHPSRVAETDINVTLGTHYLKMVLDSLDNHPVLASAAYNAGPGRARRWRGDKPLEGAIYAETIPFSETRDYVKKVMSNAVYYAALFEDKPQSLKSRLGVIQPGRRGDLRGADLP